MRLSTCRSSQRRDALCARARLPHDPPQPAHLDPLSRLRVPEPPRPALDALAQSKVLDLLLEPPQAAIAPYPAARERRRVVDFAAVHDARPLLRCVALCARRAERRLRAGLVAAPEDARPARGRVPPLEEAEAKDGEREREAERVEQERGDERGEAPEDERERGAGGGWGGARGAEEARERRRDGGEALLGGEGEGVSGRGGDNWGREDAHSLPGPCGGLRSRGAGTTGASTGSCQRGIGGCTRGGAAPIRGSRRGTTA